MSLASERTGQYFHEGHRLEYTEYGSGPRWVVLIHGQLIPRRMHEPLARALAGAGSHVIAVDLLGHGTSDRPTDPKLYSMSDFARQVIDLLDAVGADKAVIGGTSLGANVSLEVADAYPERVQGLILEMPVLDNAVEAGIIAFAPLMFVARFTPFLVTGMRLVSSIVPRRLAGFWGSIVLDTMKQYPRPMGAAVHGIFFGRIAPSSRLRQQIVAPAIVIVHPRDPIHPAADAAMLASELPNATFVRAESILEWRFRPERLTGETIAFVEHCFEEPEAVRRVRST
jgi:pimeloyl-ACP methyl ester carboxylesterase